MLIKLVYNTHNSKITAVFILWRFRAFLYLTHSVKFYPYAGPSMLKQNCSWHQKIRLRNDHSQSQTWSLTCYRNFTKLQCQNSWKKAWEIFSGHGTQQSDQCSQQSHNQHVTETVYAPYVECRVSQQNRYRNVLTAVTQPLEIKEYFFLNMGCRVSIYNHSERWIYFHQDLNLRSGNHSINLLLS